jgi:hypothetical protein
MKANKIFHLASLGLMSSLIITGCSSNNGASLPADTGNTESILGGDDGSQTAQSVVTATVAPENSSGAHAVFSTKEPFTGVTQQSPTHSDITVNCHSEYIYRTERFSGENVSRFHISKPDQAIYQYSTQDKSGVETASSNPYGLIFVDSTKAYLLRYGSNKAWIVNPSAATEEAFKIGELDLSAYSVDGSPNMASGVVSEGKLYIAMQRLDAKFIPQDAYVAVFDTATDTEIDTTPAQEGLKGIMLPVKNPLDIEFSEDSNLIYVQAVGRYLPQEFTGGIASIDPNNDFTTNLLLDDGDAGNHPIGQISGMEITSASKGFIIGYAGYKDNTLYSFNPATGKIDLDTTGAPAAVANIKNINIGGLAQDGLKQLWVSIADDANPGLRVLNSKDGSTVKELISTTLNPTTIAICDSPTTEQDKP